VDVTPSGKVLDGSKIHIVGISSHPQDKAAAIPMNTAGTPLKGECYACLDWELDDQLTIVESDEDGWDFEVRGAQLDRSHGSPTSNGLRTNSCPRARNIICLIKLQNHQGTVGHAAESVTFNRGAVEASYVEQARNLCRELRGDPGPPV